MANQGSPSLTPGPFSPAGMVLISETELAALKAEIALIKSSCEETRTKLETMRTEAAASQLQITMSEPQNSTSNTSPAAIPMSASSRKKRDSDITVSTSLLLVAVEKDATYASYLRNWCTANHSIFSVSLSPL